MTRTKITVKDLIEANKFDYCNSDITDEHFPVIDDVDISTVHPIKMEKDFTREEAIAHLKTLGMKPVSVATGLRWVKENPDYQRKHNFVCLAQSWVNSHGSECVVYFYGFSSDRSAGLGSVASGWCAGCVVLAEQELPSEPRTLGLSEKLITLENMPVGTMTVDENKEYRIVLAVLSPGVYLLSDSSCITDSEAFKYTGDTCTAFELKEMGYSIYSPDSPTEMTLEEIEKELGRKVMIKE